MDGQWLLLCIKWEERRNVKIKKEVKKERKKVNRPITLSMNFGTDFAVVV
jgi:hypothetical protein